MQSFSGCKRWYGIIFATYFSKTIMLQCNHIIIYILENIIWSDQYQIEAGNIEQLRHREHQCHPYNRWNSPSMCRSYPDAIVESAWPAGPAIHSNYVASLSCGPKLLPLADYTIIWLHIPSSKRNMVYAVGYGNQKILLTIVCQ